MQMISLLFGKMVLLLRTMDIFVERFMQLTVNLLVLFTRRMVNLMALFMRRAVNLVPLEILEKRSYMQN